MEIVLGLLIGALVGCAIALVAVLRRPPSASVEPSPQVADSLTQVAGHLGDLRVGVQSVSQRLESVERHNDALRGDVTKVQLALESTGTVASGLREATEAIRGELGKAQQGIARLQESGQARHALEASTAESLRRLEAVIAGAASKGAAGENLVDLVFSRLPIEWQMRNFRVNNKSVEFALKLPNGRALPIDSKWPATNLIEEFATAENPEAAQRVKNRIEVAVREKMREVQKYLDPELTHGFGMAVVPDAVYELCGEVRSEAFRLNVVLVGYSLFVPYLLLVYQTVAAANHDVDLERLSRVLREADGQLRTMSDEVEGRLSRAITMLDNSRNDLRTSVAKVSTGLGSVRVATELEESDAQPLLIGSD
jgi:DNA recombination protein RmuC